MYHGYTLLCVKLTAQVMTRFVRTLRYVKTMNKNPLSSLFTLETYSMIMDVSSGALLGLFLGLFLGLALGLKASADLFTPALSLLECMRKQTRLNTDTRMHYTKTKYRSLLIYSKGLTIKMQLILAVHLVQLQGY